MAVEENKALVRRYFEALAAGRPDLFDALFAPGYVSHSGSPAGEEDSGVEAIKQFTSLFHVAFPSARFTLDDLIGEEDKVMLRMTVTGRHEGPFQGLAPTGRSIDVVAIDTFRVENGRIVEGWPTDTSLVLMQQLGLLQVPGAPP
jgi:predicted ester cyclase